jgi:hypothetical protein
MKKGILQFVFFLIVLTNCFAYLDLFPNEILYQNRPSAGFSYNNQGVNFYINSKFPINTFFNYKVYDPLLAGLIQTESSFYIHAISDSNALGLFQMKPFMASEIGALNPFNPYNDKKVSALLEEYKLTLGNIDYALGAYHIGYYGVKKIIDSGNNPMNDRKINDYVQKIHSFQRLYKKGDKIPLKDYVWFDLSMSFSQPNEFSFFIVVPNYFLGSTALGIKKEEELNVSLYQAFSFFWFLSMYLGYDEGLIAGFTFKTNDWYDKISVKYDFSQDDLIWTASFSLEFLTFDIGCSKKSIFFKPGFVLKNRYFLEIPIFYSEHQFIPGISAMIRF